MRFGDYALLFSSKRSGMTRVPGVSRPQGAHRGQLPGLHRFVPLARTADAAVTLTERLPLAFDCSFGCHSTRNCSQIAGPARTEPALRASGRSARPRKRLGTTSRNHAAPKTHLTSGRLPKPGIATRRGRWVIVSGQPILGLVEDFRPVGPLWRRPRREAAWSLGVFAMVMTLVGIVAHYWVRETISQIIQTIALMFLFLLVMDLIRFWRWRQRVPPPGPRAVCADLSAAITR
jgi:hypothetical protein